MRSVITFLTVVAAGSMAHAAVMTGPIVNPANGHAYYLLEQDTWTNSEAFAQTLGGHLVTINDAAENDWVVASFTIDGAPAPRNNFWIGFTDRTQEGVFEWVAGELTSFSLWTTGQPDDGLSGVSQDLTYIIGYDNLFPGAIAGQWDDADTHALAHGVVEVIPEPASLALLGLGGLALLRRTRRER